MIENANLTKQELLEPNEDSIKKLCEVFDKGNQLFRDVKMPREAALDSEFLSLTSSLGMEQAQRIKTGFQQFNIDEFIDTVNKEIEEDGWNKLFNISQHYILSTPTVTFMKGVIGTEIEKKKTRRTNQEKDPEEKLVRPEEVSDTQADIDSEATKRVETIYNYLAKKSSGVSFWDFVFDPSSYGRTVENIFHFSFLIRDGNASLNNINSNLLAKVENPPSEEQMDSLSKNQSILKFDYNMWLKLKEERGDTTPMLPPPTIDPYNVSFETVFRSQNRE